MLYFFVYVKLFRPVGLSLRATQNPPLHEPDF